MNVILDIGEGIEADAKDVAKFFDGIDNVVKSAPSPRAMLALAILAVPVGEVISDVTAAVAAEGFNIPLDVQTAQLLVTLWPDLKAYFNTLSVKGVSTK